MKFRTLIVTSSLLLSLGTAAHASRCTSIVEQIKNDITRYSIFFSSQQLDWMNFSWLQSNLGPGQATHLSQNRTAYEWQCPENNVVFIKVTANDAKQLIDIKGESSSPEGGQLFSACITPNCSEPLPIIQPTPKIIPTPPILHKTPKVHTKIKTTTISPMRKIEVREKVKKRTEYLGRKSPPQSKTVITKIEKTTMPLMSAAETKISLNDTQKISCVDVAKQIHDISLITRSDKIYSWEDKGWLEKSFGQPAVRTNKEGTAYIWKCGDDKSIDKNIIMYFIGKENRLASFFCDTQSCYVSHFVRTGTTIKGIAVPLSKLPKAKSINQKT
jgi:hypothetical protein